MNFMKFEDYLIQNLCIDNLTINEKNLINKIISLFLLLYYLKLNSKQLFHIRVLINWVKASKLQQIIIL
jgi:hypothetical protein